MQPEPQQQDLFDQPLADMDKARKARDEGMRRVESHTEDDIPGWGERAYAFLIDYAHTGAEFRIEDVRAAAVGVIPDPPDARAWGPVAFRAARNKRIEVVRYAPAASSHGSPKPVWKVARPA